MVQNLDFVPIHEVWSGVWNCAVVVDKGSKQGGHHQRVRASCFDPMIWASAKQHTINSAGVPNQRVWTVANNIWCS
jgi:hypothetical protein